MAHARKPDFVFRRNGTSLFKLAGASVQSTTGSRGVRISGSNGNNAGYTTFRGSVTGTGYPLHSPVPPSLPHPCVTVCHHVSTGLYQFAPLVGLKRMCTGVCVCFNSRTATALRTVPGMPLYVQQVTGEQTTKETRTYSYDWALYIRLNSEDKWVPKNMFKHMTRDIQILPTSGRSDEDRSTLNVR
jgi:hypothetical protein